MIYESYIQYINDDDDDNDDDNDNDDDDDNDDDVMIIPSRRERTSRTIFAVVATQLR